MDNAAYTVGKICVCHMREKKTVAIDILHFKRARGMKKLFIFNCFLSLQHVVKHGQWSIVNNFVKCEDRLTKNCNFLQFKEFFPTVHATAVR